ncbi:MULTISPECIES: Ger(x)C family spore germination protein [Clostridium]|uniref:Spore germination protein B3 n=2 Tax=Clostridium TaxID=1485 RepID=A0A151ALQ7_9CLOT|nr:MULTISPECIES: Ger(x)C family spore germination protein [Clostridium]KYH28551.1 spore germination protein B3 precursor [Clostridium colicanis DSM 13634]PRR74161.1 hypothetical protein CPAL_10990 [Clostridium thermopalmarium DSM 5974]PVZ25489.1 Ger(x)C family germination protein [Clostridium thermopalmarium DSM 5974]
MKKIALCLIIMCSLIFTGCFNYKDINKLVFSIALVVDINEYNNPVLYIEGFRPMEGTTEGQKVIFKGEGKTIFEALRSINLGSSYKLNLNQNKIIAFTQKAAEYGIGNFIDFFDRDQELLVRPYVCVLIGDPEELLSMKSSEGEYTGIYVDRLLDNIASSSRGIFRSINDYNNQRLIGDKVNVVSMIEVKKDVGEFKKIFVNGGAIIKNDKMIGSISIEEGQGFNFLMNNVAFGTLEVTNPEYKDAFVTLEILNSKTNTNIKQEDNKVKLIKDIKVNTVLGCVQKGLIINDKNLKQLKENAESNIRKACYQIFDKYKEKGLDIFDIQEEYLRKFRKEPEEDIIKDIELLVNVEVSIESGNDTIDFINVNGK